jgi:hypothetical protein
MAGAHLNQQLYRSAGACRPASVVRTRATSIVLPPATTRSACAVASPARTSSAICSIAKPCDQHEMFLLFAFLS